MRRVISVVFFCWLLSSAGAAPIPPVGTATPLAVRLSEIRAQSFSLEGRIIEALKSQTEAKRQIKDIQRLIVLQDEEQRLGNARMAELGSTVDELLRRRAVLGEQATQHRRQVREALLDLERGRTQTPEVPHDPARDALELPRSVMLERLASRSLRETEELRADLDDADRLEDRIEEEKQRLQNLLADLQERRGILELNRRLQADILERKHEERVGQLEDYRKLKVAESQVEEMIGQFNSRKELERIRADEARIARLLRDSEFGRSRGKLPFPVAAVGVQVAAPFGPGLDPRTGIQIFRKGIEIAASPQSEVRAVFAGKVAFVGQLPGYGRVALLDHGDHFYTLCGRLGDVKRVAGDSVGAGDVVGNTTRTGDSLYFEVRARNLPVNPLQWLSRSITF